MVEPEGAYPRPGRSVASGATPSRHRAVIPAIVLIGSVCAGAVAVLLSMVPIFTHIETEFARIGVILDALHDPAQLPDVVVFGNSVGLYGIDARRLTQELVGKPRVLNLTAGAQGLAESFLYYSELPSSVRLILQVVPPIALAEARPFDAQRYNTFFMFGYRPTAATVATLTRIYGEPMADILGESAWRQKIRARWALRSFVEMQARRLLRPELDLRATQRDLYFPNPEALRLPAGKREQLVRSAIARWPVQHFETHAGQLALLGATSAVARATGRRIVYLIPPAHPEIRKARGETFYAQFRSQVLQGSSLPIAIDATDLLAEPYFIDDLHPTREGAGVWSSFIAEQLGEVL